MSALVRPLSKPAAITFGIGSALGAIACGYVGYRIVFSSFATYDDEGYFLVSIQEWLDRGQLYDGVYSEYGPGYFTLVGGLFGALGGDVDHDTARLITLGIWLAVSVLAGLSLLRLTGNPLIPLAGQLLAFVVLVIMHQDPMYPGAWLALVLIAIPAAVAFLLPTRPALGMFSIGALAALATLVKINVGGFALIAIAVACAVSIPELRRLRGLSLAAGALCVVVPFAVMASELGRPEIPRYATSVALALAAIVFAASRARESPRPAESPRPLELTGVLAGDGLPLRLLAWLAAGVGATTAVVLGTVILRGTGIGGLIEGMVVQPLGHENVIDQRLNLPGSAIAWTAAGLCVAIVATLLPRRLGERADSIGALGGLGRIAAGILIWVMVAKVSRGDVGAFGPAAAFVWLAVVPPGDRAVGSREGLMRALVALIAVLNLLQAYPVGGNQFLLSPLLLVVAGGVPIADGLGQLERRLGSRAVALNAAIALFAAWLLLNPARDALRPAYQAYGAATALGLPGAERVRTTAADAEALRGIAVELESRCGTFFSLPGMNSLYVFTGLEPPTGMNVGNWMFQFETDDQLEVRRELADVADLCVVRNRALVEFWASGRPLPRRPLLAWIESRFRPVFRVGGYELLEPERPLR